MPAVNGILWGRPRCRLPHHFVIDPATRTFGCAASTQSPGSFCLFLRERFRGLPMLTRVSGLTALAVR